SRPPFRLTPALGLLRSRPNDGLPTRTGCRASNKERQTRDERPAAVASDGIFVQSATARVWAPALARALGGAKTAQCPQGEEGGERERGSECGSDVGRRAGEEAAPGLEHLRQRVDHRDGVDPALEQRERHVDRCEEEGQENR